MLVIPTNLTVLTGFNLSYTAGKKDGKRDRSSMGDAQGGGSRTLILDSDEGPYVHTVMLSHM